MIKQKPSTWYDPKPVVVVATITGKCIFIRNFIVSEAREINNAELSDYNPVRLRRERERKEREETRQRQQKGMTLLSWLNWWPLG